LKGGRENFRFSSGLTPPLPSNELFQKAHEELRREFPLILLTLKIWRRATLPLSRAGVLHEGRLLVRGMDRGMDLMGQVEEFLKK